MDILKEICDAYVIKSTPPHDDEDILNCPLKYKLNADNECASIINLVPNKPASIVRPVKRDARNLTMDQGFPAGVFMSDEDMD